MRAKPFLLLRGEVQEKYRRDLQELDFSFLSEGKMPPPGEAETAVYLDGPKDSSALRERLLTSSDQGIKEPALLLLYGEDIPYGYADALREQLASDRIEVVRMAILHGKERVLLGGASTGRWIGRLRRHLANHRKISLVCRPLEVDEALRQLPAFLDWKSCFYLRMGEQCDGSQVRLEVVAQALGMDKRVGQGWLAEESGTMLEAAKEAWLFKELAQLKEITKIARMAFWGGESQLQTIRHEFFRDAEMLWYEPGSVPKANEQQQLIQTLDSADLLVICRANPTIRELKLELIVSQMSRPLVIDACSCYPLAEAEAWQIGYRTLGQNTNVSEWSAL